MLTRVIGLGQRAAGDDGVGLAIIAWLRRLGAPGLELFEAAEPTSLIALLETAHPVVLVDAVVGHAIVGEVLELDAAALASRHRGPQPLSTHGVDVAQAIALARILCAHSLAPRIELVGVAIAHPDRSGVGLSDPVAAAVPRAAAAVLARAMR